MEVTPEMRKEALAAIGEEAEKLLSMDLSPEVEERIELIISLARYEHDLRDPHEKARK